MRYDSEVSTKRFLCLHIILNKNINLISFFYFFNSQAIVIFAIFSNKSLRLGAIAAHFIGHLTTPPTRNITSKFSFLSVIILNKAQKDWLVGSLGGYVVAAIWGPNSRLAAFFISYFER